MFGRLCLDEAGVDVTVQVNPPLELLPLARFRPHDHPLIPVERCYELETKWRKPSS
jgi:hypothetical protein